MRTSLAAGCVERTTPCGSRLRYFELGSGDTVVVFLHGLFGNAANWLPMMQLLDPQYRYISLQLPIEKDASSRSGVQSLEQLTEHVRELLDELELESAVLGGNSLGGQIALDFCLSSPERVSGLVLAGSAGLYERHLAGGQRPRLCRDFIRDQANQIFFNTEVVCDELVEDIYSMLSDRSYRKLMLRMAKCTRDRYMLNELSNIDVPTLIVWGREDEITPPFVADQFLENIRKSKRVFIERCGHAPQLEAPEAFAVILNEFLSDSCFDRSVLSGKPR